MCLTGRCSICQHAEIDRKDRARKDAEKVRETKQGAKISQLIERAYLSGFQASGEGWNSEYPFAQFGKVPEADSDWLKHRKHDLQDILEAV